MTSSVEGGVMAMTDVQRETIRHIRECIGGQLFVSQDSNDALILVSGGAIFVDWEGYTAEVRTLEWETGWTR